MYLVEKEKKTFSNRFQAKEFYYGATEFDRNFKVNIIEFTDTKSLFETCFHLLQSI